MPSAWSITILRSARTSGFFGSSSPIVSMIPSEQGRNQCGAPRQLTRPEPRIDNTYEVRQILDVALEIARQRLRRKTVHRSGNRPGLDREASHVG